MYFMFFACYKVCFWYYVNLGGFEMKNKVRNISLSLIAIILTMTSLGLSLEVKAETETVNKPIVVEDAKVLTANGLVEKVYDTALVNEELTIAHAARNYHVNYTNSTWSIDDPKGILNYMSEDNEYGNDNRLYRTIYLNTIKTGKATLSLTSDEGHVVYVHELNVVDDKNLNDLKKLALEKVKSFNKDDYSLVRWWNKDTYYDEWLAHTSERINKSKDSAEVARTVRELEYLSDQHEFQSKKDEKKGLLQYNYNLEENTSNVSLLKSAIVKGQKDIDQAKNLFEVEIAFEKAKRQIAAIPQVKYDGSLVNVKTASFDQLGVYVNEINNSNDFRYWERQEQGVGVSIPGGGLSGMFFNGSRMYLDNFTPIKPQQKYYASIYLSTEANYDDVKINLGGSSSRKFTVKGSSNGSTRISGLVESVNNEFFQLSISDKIYDYNTNDVSKYANYGFTKANTNDWEWVAVEKPYLINLTELFGAGNEPTEAQMDKYMEEITNNDKRWSSYSPNEVSPWDMVDFDEEPEEEFTHRYVKTGDKNLSHSQKTLNGQHKVSLEVKNLSKDNLTVSFGELGQTTLKANERKVVTHSGKVTKNKIELSFSSNNIEMIVDENFIVNQTDKVGWVKDGSSWYYFNQDGVMETGWTKVKGAWYYMEDTGIMQNGWTKVGKTWYYMNNSGAMQTGWNKISNNWYYMNNSGAMQTGWTKVSNSWYYMNNSGVMQTGWLKLGGNWFYMNNSGQMQTGWTKVASNWYYMNNSGHMQTGWLKLGNTWYYLNNNGSMQTKSAKINGKWYNFNSSGKML